MEAGVSQIQIYSGVVSGLTQSIFAGLSPSLVTFCKQEIKITGQCKGLETKLRQSSCKLVTKLDQQFILM